LGYCIASSVRENLFRFFFYRFIGEKMLPNKIVSLYSIFFSKIVHQYRFNGYISEYRCPPMLLTKTPAQLYYEVNYFHISQKRGSPAKICNALPIRRDNAYL
jgi:hypothetical protein